MTGPHILHVHGPFEEGAGQPRSERLAAAFGPRARHSIAGCGGVRIAAPFSREDFPPLTGGATPARLKRLAQAMAGYDLICTYNQGALDAAMAHTLFADVFKLAPLVHHEDGLEDGAACGWGRTFYRRIALGRSAALVVTTRALEKIAIEEWRQPRVRVRLIPDGVDIPAIAARPRRDALPRVIKHKGEFWVGTLARLHADENLPALVRAFSALPEPWQLVIVGDGPERDTILRQAARSGIEHRVHLPGAIGAPTRALGLFDVFALACGSGRAAMSVVEAMAAGLPLAVPRDGDTGALAATDNGPFLSKPGDEQSLAAALKALAADADLRARAGRANRGKAREEFARAKMIERYRALYRGLLGQEAREE